MANLPETPQWEDGIYQIEVSDPVLGGPDGISNRQAKQLASRTSYLKQQVEKGGSDLAKHIAAADPHTQYATKASPTFTGTPTAPTPAANDNSKKLVTTEFVARAIAALAGTAPETLDTLKELADALGNDPNFATTVLNKLAEKLAKDQNGADIPDKAAFLQNLHLGASAFGLKNRVVFSAAGVNDWVVPDEIKNGRKAKVKVIGAGGSGGRNQGGGGGGGGGVSEALLDLTGVESVQITVGAGGIAPQSSSSTASGNAGGSSSFGSYLSATGGRGGGIPSAGIAGEGSGGDVNSSLGPGASGSLWVGTTYCTGSGGGPGGAGNLHTSMMDGTAAKGPGGGGSGASNVGGVASKAGDGADGIVIIEW
ncbi:glycine-rich domain-containing protein [Intestinirhabdus alba]|uniref:glycine-rich domain-containing protein n=1 Tax=Intestinirhabdus alba TaxID=2899544 RepID=UPI001E3D1866|nr:hypothetical protein [Intestinirhabdus alba]